MADKRPPLADAASILAALGVTAPPIDTYRVARQLGIEVQEGPHPWASSLDLRGEGPVIWLAGFLRSDQKQFAIAHGIGHLALHTKGSPQVLWHDMTFTGTPEEREANQFAAELSMPSRMVIRAFLENASLAKTAAMFGVSTLAMRYRLQNLGQL